MVTDDPCHTEYCRGVVPEGVRAERGMKAERGTLPW